MARFKTLRKKEKRYVFDFLGNRKDKNPAAAVFARFPLPDENFIPKANASVFAGIDFKKIGSKDEAEMDKMSFALTEHLSGNYARVDWEYFARECLEGFENFFSDGKEVKTVDDFLSLNPEMIALIAADCHKYARQADEFTMGE